MQAGDRLMDVIAQGQDVLTSFDIFQEAGKPVPPFSSYVYTSLAVRQQRCMEIG